MTLGVLKVRARMECPASGGGGAETRQLQLAPGCQARCAHEGLRGGGGRAAEGLFERLALLNLRICRAPSLAFPHPRSKGEEGEPGGIFWYLTSPEVCRGA